MIGDEKGMQIRLCSRCKIGVPHFGVKHGPLIICDNCNNVVKERAWMPSKDLWDIWDSKNKSGMLVPFTPKMGLRSTKTVLDLIPEWDFQSEMDQRLKALESSVKELEKTVGAFENKMNDIRDSYWLIPRDEPLTDLTLAQYDEAIEWEKKLLKFRDRALEILMDDPNYQLEYLELVKMLSEPEEEEK